MENSAWTVDTSVGFFFGMAVCLIITLIAPPICFWIRYYILKCVSPEMLDDYVVWDRVVNSQKWEDFLVWQRERDVCRSAAAAMKFADRDRKPAEKPAIAVEIADDETDEEDEESEIEEPNNVRSSQNL